MKCPECGHIWICGGVHSEWTRDKGDLLECGQCGFLFWEKELVPELFR